MKTTGRSVGYSRAVAAAAFIVASIALGCGHVAPICATASACKAGATCVSGRCLDARKVLVSNRAQRVILEPSELSVVSSRVADANSGYVCFGREDWGDVVLLMRFPSPFGDTTQIVAAYLILDPSTDSIAGPSPVTVKAARVLEPWSSSRVTWALLPRLSSSARPEVASQWANRSLRIDVTEYVRRSREHRDDDHGLAVLASPQNPVGESYSLGGECGRGPRLDVYLR